MSHATLAVRQRHRLRFSRRHLGSVRSGQLRLPQRARRRGGLSRHRGCILLRSLCLSCLYGRDHERRHQGPRAHDRYRLDGDSRV